MKKKIQINTRATREIDRYPMVAVYWLDICSDSSWQSMEGCKKAKLPTCVTHGHLLTQTKGVTRIFGDYSLSDTEDGIEKWAEINRKYSEIWPVITEKKDPPSDAKNWEGVKDKYEKHFSEKPGN